MNHPTREEWMSYLYDELTANEKTNLAAHLAVCPDCKTTVSDWRAVREDLDAWHLPAKPARVPLARPLVKWAAAAAIVLATGFGVGRLTSAGADTEKLRAAIEPEIRHQLRLEFAQLFREELDKTESATLTACREQNRQALGEFAKAVEAKRADDLQATYAALDKVESQRVIDYISLKQDVDRLAVLADASLRRTQQQLVQLADYAQRANFSNSPQE